MVRKAALAMVAVLMLAAPAAAAIYGVGDVVYRRELKEPLPNAFGGKDIFGRKRAVGFIEVRYLGLDGDNAIFARRDTRVLSNETTMNRAGAVFGSVGDQTVILSGLGPGPTRQALAPDEFRLSVAMKTEPSLLIDGVELRILSATPSRVEIDRGGADVPRGSRR